jgi:IS30 family transposase
MRSVKRSWTPSEQRLLEEMLEAKKSAAEIGMKLNRREEAVYARVQRLRLKRLLPSEGLSFSRRSPSLTAAASFARPLSLLSKSRTQALR